MNKNCEMIQDLLPLYCDNICSETSTEMIKEHLLECNDCHTMLKKLQNCSAVNLLQNESEEIINHHKQSLKRKAFPIVALIFFAVPLLVTFIVNLAVAQTLDWFFIVFASLLVFASMTFIPITVEKRKVFWTIVSFTASVLILLLTTCIYSRGDWFFMAAVPVVFGMSVLFTPVILKQLPLKNDFLKGNIALLSMLIDTMLLYAIIITVGFYANTSNYWSQAFLITTFCVLPVWFVFFIIRYSRLHSLSKAGITVIVVGLFNAFCEDFIRWINGDVFLVEMRKATLFSWSEYNIDANIKFIISILFIVIGIVLILMGRRFKKRNSL